MLGSVWTGTAELPSFEPPPPSPAIWNSPETRFSHYDFYDNVLKKRYGDKIKLLFTDTDSLCVEIETEDVYRDMQEHKKYSDCSEYPKDHFLYNIENQTVVGKLKDEEKGKIITEFVGLRSKLYSLKVQGKKEEKKVAKCVKMSVIRKILSLRTTKIPWTMSIKLRGRWTLEF